MTAQETDGRLVTCRLDELRRHPSYVRHHITVSAAQVSALDKLGDLPFRDPVLITLNGTVLDGYARWEIARLKGRPTLNCLQCEMTEEEALQCLVQKHSRSNGLNQFCRIVLALELEAWLREKALSNQRAGGHSKGSANLPEAQHIDVRQEIARAAGVGARNVSKVKTILEVAHPRLKEALRDGMLTINRAIQFCKFPRAEQLEKFIRYNEERATNKVIRRSIARPKENAIIPDVGAVLDALQHQEARRPGSVAVRVGRHERTVVLIGQGLFASPHFQKEAKPI